MPITAWTCSGCDGRTVPLDHFATSSCGLTVCHPSFAAAVLHHDRAHYARGSGVVEVSHGLGCPRQVGIELEDNAVNPVDYNPAIGGTGWHEYMEASHNWAMVHAPEMVVGIQREHRVMGKLGMVPVQGKIDVLRRNIKHIDDDKTKNDFVAKHLKDAPAQENDRIQVSIYSALTEQQDDWRPETGSIWYRFQAGGFIPKAVKLAREDEFLEYKPTSGEYTVLELLRTTDSIMRGHLKWQDTPLIGKTMYYGAKTKCDYCPVRDKCWTQATGANF